MKGLGVALLYSLIMWLVLIGAAFIFWDIFAR
jgi:hypothetical protein